MGHPFRYLDKSAPKLPGRTMWSVLKEHTPRRNVLGACLAVFAIALLMFVFNESAHTFVQTHLPTSIGHAFDVACRTVGYGTGVALAGYPGKTRQGNQIDLRTQGGTRTVVIPPAGSVQFIHDPQQARIGASSNHPGLYNYIRKYTLQCKLTAVRANVGEGTPELYADVFPTAIKSIGLTSPMHGTLIDPSIVDGMVAKHIMEWHMGGYVNPTIKRQPIPAVNGTYTRYFELELFFAQYWNEEPDQFDVWLGWLDNSILEIFCQDAADPFNDGGVTSITDLEVSVIIETVPWSTVVIPPFVVLRRYEQAAGAGSNGPKLQNVGDAGALQGTDDGARLLGMFFSHQAGGFTGSGTADEIATLQMPWRDQAQTYFPSLMVQRYLRDTGLRSLGIDAGVDLYDLPQEPYPMPGTASNLTSGTLSDPTARFTPLVWPTRGNKISQVQRVKGNYPLDGMTFNASQSNVFRVYTLELKQWSLSKVSEMVTAMAVDPAKVIVVPKSFKGTIPKGGKAFGMPRFIAQAK